MIITGNLLCFSLSISNYIYYELLLILIYKFIRDNEIRITRGLEVNQKLQI